MLGTPERPLTNVCTRAVVCKEEGSKCMSCKDYVNAMKWYSQAIMLSPKEGALYSNRSFAFLQLGLTSRALATVDTFMSYRINQSCPFITKSCRVAPGHYCIVSTTVNVNR
jgi:hypothetical protein